MTSYRLSRAINRGHSRRRRRALLALVLGGAFRPPRISKQSLMADESAIYLSRASNVPFEASQSLVMDALIVSCGGPFAEQAYNSCNRSNFSCHADDTKVQLAERLGAGLSYLLLSLMGAVFYGIFLTALWRNRQYYSRHSFYVIVCHLAVGDIGIIATQFFVAVPLSLSGRNIYESATVVYALSAIDTVCFKSVWLTTGWIALNRCSYFTLPRLYRFLFTKPHVHLTMATSWVLGAIYLLFYMYEGCYKTFDANAFYYKFDCPEIPKSPILHSVIYISNTALPIMYMLMYLGVVAKIKARRKHSTVARSRQNLERNLLLQGFLICAMLSLEVAVFAIPSLTARLNINIPGNVVSMIVTWIVIINSMINPVIFFVFSGRIKRDVLWLLRIRSSDVAIECSYSVPML
uniref:G-protein coupled receptors family 1 profile domain-containing protein n=1 Tax=Plectus sambesii TaxID=2011161 RepID=A0A914VAS2_9BILA